MTGKYIDMHCHMLPGVDDGADSWETCRKMLSRSVKEGAAAVILTPHYYPGHMDVARETITVRIEELRKRMASQWNLPLEVYQGNEFYYTYDIPELLAEGSASSMADSNYVLVEFSTRVDPMTMQQSLTRLLEAGYYPILAHVERYETLYQNYEQLRKLDDMGVYLQANAQAICGKDGFRVRRFLRKLLDQEMITFVGTDAHDLRQRAPQMGTCVQYLQRKYSEDYTRWLLYDNPACILRNERI